MRNATLFTFITRAFSAGVLTLIAGAYAARGDVVPVVIFGLASMVVWGLTLAAYRALRRLPQGQDEKKP